MNSHYQAAQLAVRLINYLEFCDDEQFSADVSCAIMYNDPCQLEKYLEEPEDEDL